MSRHALLPFALFTLVNVVGAQDYFSPDPLVDKVVPYDQIPYQVMTDRDDPRGFQTGYNICNSTTENQNSICQTMFVNHIDDWCIWSPPSPNSAISDAEANVVAWCSGPGHGTRIMPPGAITGLQYIQTPSYIQIAGTMNQALLNIAGADGGELDSGGQDGEGNPMGGLIYSNSFPSNHGNNNSFQQVQHWSFFVGGNTFCAKLCDQTGPNPWGLCNNIYDRLGCEYNAPNNAQEGVFERCDGDDMTPVGTYVVDGVTSVYTQPAETDPINNVPYTPTIAASSNCVPYQSADIFNVAGATFIPGSSGTLTSAVVSVTISSGSSTSANSAATGTSIASGASGSLAKTSARTTASASVPTSSSTGASSSTTTSTSKNGAAPLGMSLGAVAVALFVMLAQN